MSSIAASCCSGDQQGGPKISFANGVWVDKRFPVKPSFQQCVRDAFKAEAKNVDFSNQADEAVEEINSWVESQTNGLISGVLDSQHIDPLTALVLGNALYFKGYWKNKFNPKRTEERDFYPCKISVPFMTSSCSYLYGSFDNFKALEIPYQSGKQDEKHFSMQFLLPNEKDGLQNLLEQFNADSYGLINRHNFQLTRTEFKDFWIPKFKFLYNLGNIKFPFMEEPMELTEMVHLESGEHPVISNIVQKAVIEVDEQGTEAAAFTGFDIFGPPPTLEEKLESFWRTILSCSLSNNKRLD
ncbi:unnamed protein product [Coffea canephora]|uniref:Serpin domain-containing protein n=1 Tax=Coffea canephora TaxID=49390 RepID=A0A068TXA4_COFCA|nr:unnamed protein product [Coffea canephora]